MARKCVESVERSVKALMTRRSYKIFFACKTGVGLITVGGWIALFHHSI
jgi:hypothetical protein